MLLKCQNFIPFLFLEKHYKLLSADMHASASQGDFRARRWEQCWLREEQAPNNTPESPSACFLPAPHLPPTLSTVPEQVGLWEVGGVQEPGLPEGTLGTLILGWQSWEDQSRLGRGPNRSLHSTERPRSKDKQAEEP